MCIWMNKKSTGQAPNIPAQSNAAILKWTQTDLQWLLWRMDFHWSGCAVAIVSTGWLSRPWAWPSLALLFAAEASSADRWGGGAVRPLSSCAVLALGNIWLLPSDPSARESERGRLSCSTRTYCVSGPHARTLANIALAAPRQTRRKRPLWFFNLRQTYKTCSSSGNRRLSPPTITHVASI